MKRKLLIRDNQDSSPDYNKNRKRKVSDRLEYSNSSARDDVKDYLDDDMEFEGEDEGDIISNISGNVNSNDFF